MSITFAKLAYFNSSRTYISIVYPLEVVCRGSETHLQVGKNKLNQINKLENQ